MKLLSQVFWMMFYFSAPFIIIAAVVGLFIALFAFLPIWAAVLISILLLFYV